MNARIDELLQHPGLWRGRSQEASASTTAATGYASGYPDLDALLPGGWPQGALSEILIAQEGIGELRLVMPALAQISHSGRWVAWVAPPYIPYAPALAASGVDLSRILLIHPKQSEDALWTVEQALRAGTCGAVLAWPRQADDRSLRRLQLAAEAGQSWGLLFRPREEATRPSPAALRLQLEPETEGLGVHVLKRRGGWGAHSTSLDLDQSTQAELDL